METIKLTLNRQDGSENYDDNGKVVGYSRTNVYSASQSSTESKIGEVSIQLNFNMYSAQMSAEMESAIATLKETLQSAFDTFATTISGSTQTMNL